MGRKLFVSYSHQDEAYRAQLEVHLSAMKRKGIVDVWHDKKITPGESWKNEIDVNLAKADVVLLLVSPDFIASDYCMDIELATAIARNQRGLCVVIPVILRHCMWKDSFGQLQALPDEGKPVFAWGDRDEVWMKVVEGISLALNKMAQVEQPFNKPELLISQAHKDWLEDTEVVLSHRKVDEVLLSAVYVPPDLKVLTTDIDKLAESNEEIMLIEEGQYIVFGSEQSGKTSFAKSLFRLCFEAGKVPIILNGKDISRADIKGLTAQAYKLQYDFSDEIDLDLLKNKVVIIDDFSDVRLNKKFTNKLIHDCTSLFGVCIFTASEAYQYVAPDLEKFEGFKYLEILPFGNQKRAALIEKWVALGLEEQLDEADLYKRSDEIKLRLDSLVRKNIVPAKPIYLLSVLQMLEAYSPQRLDLTSYGHCYQHLVYQALERANIKHTEIDKYLNVMTELAWTQFLNNGIALDRVSLESFFIGYEKKFLKVDRKKVIDDLLISNILTEKANSLGFKYSYIYYFFAAKHIAESFSESNVKENVRKLLDRLHREDCANIIIFITHHTKDNWVLDEIQVCLMELFEEQAEATLESSSLNFLEEFMENIPDLVLEQRKVEKERLEHNKSIDRIDQQRERIDKDVDLLEPTDIFARINKVFKGIEIVGQIVRNRHASLSKEKLSDMVSEGMATGLRFLQFFLGLSASSKDDVLKMIETILRDHPSISNEGIEKEAKKTFLFLTYGVIYGVIRKISSSLGSVEAEEIYKGIESSNPTPAIMLINQAIQLQFQKQVSFEKLDSLRKEFIKNPTCMRMLRETVIQHTYMFPVEYKDKQRIAESLRVPMASQRLMDLRKANKV